MRKFILGMAVFWGLLLPFSAQAAEMVEKENPLIYEARNGVLQVNLTYVSEDGQNHIVQGGSGFLIGNEEGAEYLITSFDCVNVTEELRNRVVEEFEIDEERDNLQFLPQVVVKRDITIDAEIVTCSEEMNIAVLKLSQNIYDRLPLMLDVDAEIIAETAAVYTLGFPEDIQEAQDISYYTQEDVSVMNGIVSKKTTINGILFIQHSAVVSNGNSGGPLLNEAGHVIGMNQVLLNDGYYYSVHISEIASILDALGIPYTSYVPEVIVDTTMLETAVSLAEAKDLSDYTQESCEVFLMVLGECQNICVKEGVTQEEVDTALLDLKSAEAALTVRSDFNYLLLGGIVILLLFILVIVLLIILLKNRSRVPKEQKLNVEINGTKWESERQFTRVPSMDNPSRLTVESPVKGRFATLQQGVMEETTVLGADSGNNAVIATLVRVKTNENIAIRKLTFYLGKDAQKADYCIKDNPSVSRSHAVIKQINGEFFLEDLQATNGTFHNGIRLQPAQSVRLASGDRIRLANEEFRISM